MNIGKHKWLIINLFCIVAFFLASFFIFKGWLNSYTAHGESVTVPDLSNIDYEAARILAEREGLKVKINDTLSVEYVEPGMVVDHFPIAGAKVKAGRTIYLSLNSTSPIMVIMPNVTDVSLRQATQILENRGLKVGVLEYKPDFADNYVFEQRYKAKEIAAGTKIPKGSAIDLLVGKGGKDAIIPIPNLIGLSWRSVQDSLVSRGLNVNPIFGNEVISLEDSMQSFVQKQSPLYVEGGKMTAGEVIDLWLGKNTFSEDVIE